MYPTKLALLYLDTLIRLASINIRAVLVIVDRVHFIHFTTSFYRLYTLILGNIIDYQILTLRLLL